MLLRAGQMACVAALFFAACVLPEKQDKTVTALGKINKNGLELAQIGSPFANIYIPERDSLKVKDSTVVAEDFMWLVKTITTPHGEFVFESEAVSAAERELLPKKNIARVRITVPNVQTPEGVGIGSTVADLIGKFTADSLSAIAIPEYKKIQIASPRGHFVYLIDDFGSGATQPVRVPLATIPTSAKVTWLVMM